MKKALLSKQAKIVVDILLVIGLAISLTRPTTNVTSGSLWKSAHCIICVMWVVLTIIHIWQHWRFIKALSKKKVLKNKITALITICFIPMLVSILLFLIDFDSSYIKYHGGIGRIYALLIIIHTIQKFKRFTFLFKRNKTSY